MKNVLFDTPRRFNYTDCMPMTGAQLRRLRKRMKLTQKQLAENLGVTENTFARWERDEVKISEVAARFARAIAKTPGAKI
jgi:transcriptional regulator with XRE-family HTH domain